MITEESPRLLDTSTDKVFLKTDDYALAKAREENILFNSGKTNYTIIRPYMTYFPYRLDLGFYPKELWLYRVLKGKSVLFPENVANRKTTLTYGYDVAKGIASIIGEKKALGEIYHITQDNAYTWRDVFIFYIKALNKNNITCDVKYIQSDESFSYINIYDRQYDRIFDNTKIREYVDTSTFMPLEHGITKCIEDFLKSPSFKSIDWKLQAHWDRILHEQTMLAEIKGIKSKFLYIVFRWLVSYTFVKRVKQIIKPL